MPTRRTRWPLLPLLLLCSALYLPGLRQLPPVDRDEARYAQAAREMLAAGDWVLPRLQNEPRLRKPIGAYWLQAIVVRGTGAESAIAAHRLPSVAGALIAVLVTFLIGRRWFASHTAWLGAALLASASLMVVEAHLATTDALLLAAVVVMQGCLAALYAAARRGRLGRWQSAAGFWLALAAGVLIKGPVAPLLAVTTLAALALADRTAPRRSLVIALRPNWGVALAAACIAPWAVAAGHAAGWQALPSAMLADLTPKLLGAHESHGAPPGAYLLTLPATFWPGSLALLFFACPTWRRRRRTPERFLLAWLVPAWLLFECLPTKLPHYVLPTFPALALLVARAALSQPRQLRPSPQHPVARTLASGWALLTLAIGAIALIAAVWLGNQTALVASALCVAICAAVGAIALRRFWRAQLSAALCTAVLGAVSIYALLLSAVLPNLDALWPSRAAATAIEQAGAGRAVAAVGYHEISILLLTRRGLSMVDAAGAVALLAAQPDALVLITDAERPAFMAAARQRGLELRTRWSTHALNYSRGDWIDLDLIERDTPLGHAPRAGD
ncbi:MAG: phospholipid carrier-dependent glycosyltransferase [Deltaproteobacteria bacterium]|nr:phospholipid carrier-dependent glycosyltransferase [Deltaproteobacteria bacterium]